MVDASIYWSFAENTLMQKSDFHLPGFNLMEAPTPLLPFGHTTITTSLALIIYQNICFYKRNILNTLYMNTYKFKGTIDFNFKRI